MQNCPFLPLNISSFFPKLEILQVTKSNVQHLMTGDLDGLDSLKDLVLSNNPIDQIGHDFFLGAKSLMNINFDDCHLKKIDAQAFDHLTKLRSISLENNDCISNFYSSSPAYNEYTLRRHVKPSIEQNCQGTPREFQESIQEKCLRRAEQSGNTFLDTFVIVTLVLLVAIVSILVAVFVYTFQKTFKGNWSQMRRFL
jgi:hypothetical protein